MDCPGPPPSPSSSATSTTTLRASPRVSVSGSGGWLLLPDRVPLSFSGFSSREKTNLNAAQTGGLFVQHQAEAFADLSDLRAQSGFPPPQFGSGRLLQGCKSASSNIRPGISRLPGHLSANSSGAFGLRDIIRKGPNLIGLLNKSAIVLSFFTLCLLKRTYFRAAGEGRSVCQRRCLLLRSAKLVWFNSVRSVETKT